MESGIRFLKNAWYIAAWSNEVQGEALFNRVLLGDPVLLFRDQGGDLVALGDRCPHRFAPLHMGKRTADCVTCPYHGLQFDRHGACVFSPHGDGAIPPKAKVHAYPVQERSGVIWIWMGEPSLADASAIPDYGFLDEGPSSSRFTGYMYTKANYQLLADNILDLSHADFLHPGFLSSGGAVARQRPRIEHTGRGIQVSWDWSSAPPMAVFAFGLPGVNDADGWISVNWEAAGNMRLDSGSVPAGRPRREGVSVSAIHCMTPETETTTHYFFGSRRDYLIDDDNLNEQMKAATWHAFAHEDKPVIEAVQLNMATDDLWSLEPAILSSDVGAVQIRRAVEKMLRAEASAQHAHH